MDVPHIPFFLFGMGQRTKLLYRRGELLNAQSGRTVRRWDMAAESILPGEYRVELCLVGGGLVEIYEDEAGVWVNEGRGPRRLIKGEPLNLPRYEGHPHAETLRRLHHELLINIVDGRPVPNLFVYPRPWYRDAAMVSMALERTGNLHLVADWINSLSEPFDLNNAGQREPDNLGQLLYLLSLGSDASHPLVRAILEAVKSFEKGGQAECLYISGNSDFAPHPVYQTKWLKFGLRSLGLPDPYTIPAVYDSYSPLFWMDYRDAHIDGPPFDDSNDQRYPYLTWAEAHFHRADPPALTGAPGYPLTWEAHASQADYARMSIVSDAYVNSRTCVPHSWHAAEMFLYLLERTEDGP
jgi:hypothetical protein